MSKILNIAVLCGGNSPEKNVSIKSGERVAEALRRKGYNAITVDPCTEYEEGADVGVFSHQPTPLPSAKTEKSIEFTASSLKICKLSDAVFMALHGGAGENGMIAAVLECNGIKHTGSKFKGMCISMDKCISKKLIEAAGILTPEYVYIPEKKKKTDTSPIIPPFPPPYIIKPADGGSSIGIKPVTDPQELNEALNGYTKAPASLLVERMICGREFTVGILNGGALAVTEIIPRSGFYDYENKYVRGRTEEITPANVSAQTEKRLKDTAILVNNALFLDSYSRVDIILESGTDRLYVLEANALPGMTETSLLPQGAAASGIDFDTLCETMLSSAL